MTINSRNAEPAYLSALGLVNALGYGRDEIARRLFAGDGSGLTKESCWRADGGDALVGRVASELPIMPAHLVRHNSRNNRLLLASLEQIRTEVDEAISRFGRSRIGVVIGTSTSGIAEGEPAIAEWSQQGALPKNFYYTQQEIGASAPFLAEYLGLLGPAYTVSTACTSSAKALVSARLLLNAGICDAVLAGGADSLCRLTVSGFAALESVSPVRCNPMSLNRCGINIGEGSVLFLVTRQDAPIALLGCGETSDAHHMSAPEPNGRGAERAMQSAMSDAGVTEKDIAYVNLHGTATQKNDEMESRAMHRVFPDGVPASSTKPLTGHMLGAAGATEAAFCWLALAGDNANLPPHVWDEIPDPSLPQLHLVKAGECMNQQGRRILLSNGYAFGGSNVSLVIGDVA